MALGHMYLTWFAHSNLSCSHQQCWTDPLLLRKKGSRLDPQCDGWPIRRSILSFSPKVAIEALGIKPTLCWWLATRLTWTITSACDQYFQYLLAGTNPSVLKWHRRGLQPYRSQLYTSHSPPFPSDDPPLFPKGPAQSQVNHSQH
jgi:hypothetical protein